MGKYCAHLFLKSISLSFPHSSGQQRDSIGQWDISGCLLETSRGNSVSRYRYWYRYCSFLLSSLLPSFPSPPFPPSFPFFLLYSVCNVDGISQGGVAIFATSGYNITPGRAEEEGRNSTPDVGASSLTCPPLASLFHERSNALRQQLNTKSQVSLICNQTQLTC